MIEFLNGLSKVPKLLYRFVRKIIAPVLLGTELFLIYRVVKWSGYAEELSMMVLIFGLVILIILLLAYHDAYFTKVDQGTTVFINAGGSLKEILPNVSGFKLSKMKDIEGQRWLISEEDLKEDKEEEKKQKRLNELFNKSPPSTRLFQKWLWETFGVRFISPFWPQVKRHSFDIRSRKRLLEGSDVPPDTSLKDRVVDSPSLNGTIVDSLLFLVPRPVYLHGIQLPGDNSRINLLIHPIYRQIIPALPVYHLKGDFFTQLDAALESSVMDFFATHSGGTLNYVAWLKLPKGGGNSPLEEHLRTLNFSKSYRSKLVGEEKSELVTYIDKLTGNEFAQLGNAQEDNSKNEVGSGIVPRFGFALISFRIVDWEPHLDTKPLAEALLAKQTEFHRAEGVREAAYGKRDADIAIADGEAARFKKPIEAITGLGVTKDVAADVLRTDLRTRNIGGKDSKIVTYVEGGEQRSSILVPSSATTPA